MMLWHKKRALTWPPELKSKLIVSNIFNFNSTTEGRRIQ